MDASSKSRAPSGPVPIRRTVQGEIIRTVFEDAQRPLSSREAHELALKIQPRIGIATVYRAINRFIEEGLVTPVDIPGVGTQFSKEFVRGSRVRIVHIAIFGGLWFMINEYLQSWQLRISVSCLILNCVAADPGT